ncbi:MAG: hypothetical protein ACJASU_001050 [Cognaticolwellia sp.]|jgi:hypothetical protein
MSADVTLSPDMQGYTNAVQPWRDRDGHMILTYPHPKNKNARQVTGIDQQFTC